MTSYIHASVEPSKLGIQTLAVTSIKWKTAKYELAIMHINWISDLPLLSVFLNAQLRNNMTTAQSSFEVW